MNEIPKLVVVALCVLARYALASEPAGQAGVDPTGVHPTGVHLTVKDVISMSASERSRSLEQLSLAELDRVEEAFDAAVDRLVQSAHDARRDVLRVERSIEQADRTAGRMQDLVSAYDPAGAGLPQLKRFGQSFDDVVDELVASIREVSMSGLQAEKSMRSAHFAVDQSAGTNSPRYMHLLGCQFSCNNAKAGCDVDAIGILTRCRVHMRESHDCDDDDWACIEARIADQIFCANQLANRQACSEPWFGCQKCCSNISNHDSTTQDFAHCDDAWDDVELDESLP